MLRDTIDHDSNRYERLWLTQHKYDITQHPASDNNVRHEACETKKTKQLLRLKKKRKPGKKADK